MDVRHGQQPCAASRKPQNLSSLKVQCHIVFVIFELNIALDMTDTQSSRR